MNPGDRDGERPRNDLGRRAFLVGAAASAAAIAVGCTSSSSSEGSDTGSTSASTSASTTSPPVTAPEPELVPTLAADPFRLGVASGDPRTDSVILWTRLAPDPLADDGAAGMDAPAADLIWEVAETEDFSDLVATGVVRVTAEHGHSAHVEASGLSAGSDYHYRFRYADWTSPVGRTRTLPDGSPEAFALGIVNCQMIETGRYGAYRHLAEEDLDLVVHLGDYIYEYPTGDGEFAAAPNRLLETLADYRIRYAAYHLDESLQGAHQRFPFVLTWDDHEVANNYMGDVLVGIDDPSVGQDRKAAAYRAWWENLPTRLDAPEGSALTVYQDLAAGDLFRLHLLDERQDSDVPPCRDSAGGDEGDCAARTDEDRTRLGPDQEAWLEQSLAKGGVTWNLLGNPVVLAGVNAGTDRDNFYLDTWDGFPQARVRLIEQLAKVDNPVVLTGDYHAGMVLDVQAVPFDRSSALVAPEFMAPPISSGLFSADVSARTPQLRQQINEHGYLTVDVEPTQLTVRFRTVADVNDLQTAITTAATWTVAAGDPTPQQI